jgi:hypothetical protein
VSLEEALGKTHHSLSVKSTTRTLQNLSKLYMHKGLEEEALMYQMQAYESFLTTNEIDLQFLILEI